MITAEYSKGRLAAKSHGFLNKRLLTVLALAALLWLAGIIILPALGSPYVEPAQALTDSLSQIRPYVIPFR